MGTVECVCKCLRKGNRKDSIYLGDNTERDKNDFLFTISTQVKGNSKICKKNKRVHRVIIE